LSTGFVCAAPATVASVWTEDIGGTVKNTFAVGETVYVHWTVGADGGTVNIIITDNAFTTIAILGTTVSVGAQPLTWTPSTPGTYYVMVQGATNQVYPIAVSSLFVVPESLLGTLMAITAGFAAFGTITAVGRKRSKSKKD
jgi:hypothetical protein